MKFVSWNIEGRLTRWTKEGRGSPESIVEHLIKLDGDVVFCPEGYSEGRLDEQANAALVAHGYTRYDGHYQDQFPSLEKSYQPVMVFYSKVPLKVESVLVGGIRTVQVATLQNGGQQMRIIGVHLHDRYEHLRLSMLDDLVPLVTSSKLPTIMMGDFNAMHGRDWRAWFLRRGVTGLVARILPGIFGTLIKRLHEMGDGRTLRRLLKDTNLREVDVRLHATTTPKLRSIEWMPSIRMFQIDHMLASPDIIVSNYRISSDGGADHRALVANVIIKP